MFIIESFQGLTVVVQGIKKPSAALKVNLLIHLAARLIYVLCFHFAGFLSSAKFCLRLLKVVHIGSQPFAIAINYCLYPVAHLGLIVLQ